MIILTQTTDSIKVYLKNTVATNQMQCYAAYRDSTSSAFAPSRNVATTNNTTAVNLVAPPASAVARGVDYMSIFNADTSSNTVVVVLDLNGTQYELSSAILLPGEKLEYTDVGGFVAKTADGKTKVDVSISTNALAMPLRTTVISSDVVNSTTSFADVTDLSISLKAKTLYRFSFFIRYESALTTTGSAWSINGPAFNYLAYNSNYNLTTSVTNNANLIAYDSGTLATSTTYNTNGRAYIDGLIEPSEDGTLIARFRTEINTSAITAKAGSFVRWRELYKYN